MTWIADVAPYDTIQSLWGNSIRDRVVLDYASKAERDSHTTHDGQVCVTLDTGIVYVRVSGQWWVLAMPWRAFTPKAYFGTQGNGSDRQVMPISGSGYWAQTLGRCHVLADYNATLTIGTGVNNYYLWTYSPVQATVGGGAGPARVFHSLTGQAHGGHCRWSFHDAPGSGFIMENVGPGVTPNVVVQNSTSQTASLNFSIDLTHPCAPTVDTP